MENAADLTDLAGLKDARRLWVLGRWDEAEAAFEKVAAAHPGNLRAQIDTARVLGDRSRISEARQCVERIAPLAQRIPEGDLILGQTWRMCGREEESLAALTRYAAGPGKKSLVAHLELAVMHERHRRLDAADASVGAVLRLAPTCWEAMVIRARVRTQQGRGVEAEGLLRRIVREKAVAPTTKAEAWTMLASLAEKGGRFPEALSLLESAKALMRAQAGKMAEGAFRGLGAWATACRDLTPETAQRWWSAADAAKTQWAHLIGFPRSGTTLLENILDAHPDLISAEERQILARDLLNGLWREPGQTVPPTIDALDRVSAEKLATLRQRYAARMADALDEPLEGRVLLDKNPTHTLFLPGIMRLLPGSKILVALRDPRDVVTSCYFQYLPLNPQSACFLTWEQTVRRYVLDMTAWQHLRTVLPRESWLEVRYEDVVEDMETEARRAVDFLGLPWHDAVLNYRAQVAEKVVHTPSYVAVAQPLTRQAIGRWKNYATPRALQPHLEALRPLVEAFGYQA